MAGSDRQILRNSIEEVLIPRFRERGFELVPLDGEDAKSREIQTSFPFGRLRRKVSDHAELAEIQLDKYGPAFRINLGIAAPEGLQIGQMNLSQEQVWVHFLPEYFEFYSVPWIRRWFRVPWKPLGRASESAIRSLVERVSSLLPEVDIFFAEGRQGLHMRRISQ